MNAIAQTHQEGLLDLGRGEPRDGLLSIFRKATVALLDESLESNLENE